MKSQNNGCFFFLKDEEVDEMYREAPIKNGMFDYQEFTRILKHGAKEKDEAWIFAWAVQAYGTLQNLYLKLIDFWNTK